MDDTETVHKLRETKIHRGPGETRKEEDACCGWRLEAGGWRSQLLVGGSSERQDPPITLVSSMATTRSAINLIDVLFQCLGERMVNR